MARDGQRMTRERRRVYGDSHTLDWPPAEEHTGLLPLVEDQRRTNPLDEQEVVATALAQEWGC